MKVLLVSTKCSVFTEPIRGAFESLGCEVETVDYWGNPVLMPGGFIHKVVGRMPSFLKYAIFDIAQLDIDSKILSQAKYFNPDLVFVIKGKNIRLSNLKKLRTIGKTANYYPETFDHWERMQRITPHYDYFFNYDPEVIRELKKIGHNNAFYLPFSADAPQDINFNNFSQRKYPISFIGSFMPIRYSQREIILSQVKDLGLNIWGNKAWLDTGLKDYYRSRPSDEEMMEIYRNSKIVINIDLMKGVKGTGVNLRPFEVTSCGAALFNHDDRKDIFNLFRDGKEFVSFKDPEDIRQKVEHYLNQENELEAIAKAGFERTKNSHTYLARIKQVLETVFL